MSKLAALGLALAILPCLSHAGAEPAAPSPIAVRHAVEALLPPGVILKEVKLAGERVSVNGKSQSNQQVSSFMRRIDSSTVFRSPNLMTIEKSSAGSDYAFSLSMEVHCPKPGEHVANNPCEASAPAAATVFKCTVNGATAYQSTPCAAGTKR